ncbi:hypothetical protein KI387_028247, partial [Taxus chinensis]
SDKLEDGSSGPSLDDHPILRESTDVFLGELPGMPPLREIYFHIDLFPGAETIAQAPVLDDYPGAL